MDNFHDSVADKQKQPQVARADATILEPGGPADRTDQRTSKITAGSADAVDPIYGEDAAKRYVADHFDKAHPFAFTGVTAEQAAKHKDLAIFVNLAANRGLLNSSLREDDELQRLEMLTKDKPVTVVVQVAMNRDRSLDHLRATKEDLIISELGGLGPDKSQTEVVRYEIANGSKRLISAGHSRGLTEDLGDLLQSDPDAMKASRIVLLNRAHGEAMHGILGDAGNTSIADLKSTILQSLQRAGRKSFDVIDFDSCLIGNEQTLASLAPTAKYIIASEEPEVAIAQTVAEAGKKDDKAGANAQPITAAVKKLLLEPDMDSYKAATSIWSTNETECHLDSKDGLCGANTLSVYKADAAPALSSALNNFGQAMIDTMKMGANKTAFKSAINKAPLIDGEYDGLKGTVHRRDLTGFLNQINTELNTHSISDTSNGELHSASAQLQKAIASLTIQNFNSYKPSLRATFLELKLPPAEMGGISVFLPDSTVSTAAFIKESKDDSIPSEPAWNQFVQAMRPE